jgi:hypothetical protein
VSGPKWAVVVGASYRLYIVRARGVLIFVGPITVVFVAWEASALNGVAVSLVL